MYHRWSFLFRCHVLSDGAWQMAEEHGAYWLMDAIASYHSRCMKNAMLREIQFWTLTVKNGKGTLICQSDSGQKPIITQKMDTDFPEGETKLWVALHFHLKKMVTPSDFGGEMAWVIYLPSEH